MVLKEIMYRHLEGNQQIRIWDSRVGTGEPRALQQIQNIASLPGVEGIAVMPDYHYGIGATVGSVIALRGAVIPSAVGVDIGCGMMAVRTRLSSHDLPENLGPLRSSL